MSTALSRAQMDDVLRYWLSALKLEEALAARPVARHPGGNPERSARPRVDMPTPGQDYFKLAMDQAFSALLSEQEACVKPLSGELSGFFETWLHGQYRRGEDDAELSHLLCFPIVHLPRGELAGVVRRGVRLRFSSAGKWFRAPSRSERARGLFPDPPTEVHVQPAALAEGAWPFFIDTRLLRHPLGVAPERIDALFDALRERETTSELEMLTLLVQTLEESLAEAQSANARAIPFEASPSSLGMDAVLQRLTHAVRALLAASPSRAQVYPVGIVLDGTQAKTTWHLQREIAGLLEGEPKLVQDTALGAYLGQRPLVEGAGSAFQRALYEAPNLTDNQRAVADAFWNSRLSSVQGPPGTGKTTLILHLCAEAIVRQVEGLVDRGRMDDALFVVVSSNNRAVDNVIEPLAARDGLPLALRGGNRQVCEHQLSAQLRRALAFLENAERSPMESRTREFEAAKTAFVQCRAQLDRVLLPRRLFLESANERATFRRALDELKEPSFDARVLPLPLPEPRARALALSLSAVERRLSALSELCEAQPGILQVNAVARHYGRTADKTLPELEAALLDAGLSLDLPLPPLVAPMDTAALMEAWQEATESALAKLSTLSERLERERQRAAWLWETERLKARLSALGEATTDTAPSVPAHEAESRALFASAVALRETWARLQAASCKAAVMSALSLLEEQRSLRPMFRDRPEQARTLSQLFGVWGATLLSLGNCFPAEEGMFSRVVVDEAGQCHPAHAVSALLRSDAAMVIGDVNQLAPVIEIEADDEARLVSALGPRVSSWLLPFRVHSRSQASTQALSDGAVPHRPILVDHFRCQPEIIAVSDALCGYGLRVHSTPKSRVDVAPFLSAPLLHLQVSGQQERRAGSLCNERECEETLSLVSALLASGIDAEELAVITPYRGQLELLRRGLYDLRVPLELSAELRDADGPVARASNGMALGTVHRFQGGERSIVLFSSVISEPSALPFLNHRPNLLNVAVSRAQHHFVCIGEREVLSKGQRTRVLVSRAQPLPSQRRA